MKRKFSYGLSFLLVCTSALANGEVEAVQAPYRYYLGGDISANSSNYRAHVTDLCLSCGNTLSRTFDTKLSNVSGGGGLYAGVNRLFVFGTYLGLEAFVDWSADNARNSFNLFGNTASTINDLRGVSFAMKQPWDFGLSLTPGLCLTEVLSLYGRVGWVRGRFNYRGNASAIFPAGASDTQNINGHKNQSGLQVGLGLQGTLREHLGLRAEWDLNDYQSFSKPIFKTGSNTIEGTLTFSHPMMNQFKLGIFYLV